MDANGTRYHLLLGRGDWGACSDELRKPNDPPTRTLADVWDYDSNTSPLSSPPGSPATLAWNEDAQELTLRPSLSLIVTPSNPRLRPEQRRGAARDRYGNWYWIDENGTEIKVHSAGSSETTHFWSATDRDTCEATETFGEFGPAVECPPPKTRSLNGLAVTEDHYLVVGTVSPPALFVFDLHSGGPPRELPWPAEVPFAPFDFAARRGGGVWILDRMHRVYWEFDRHFRPLPAGADVLLPFAASDFSSVSGAPLCPPKAQTFPAGNALEHGSPIDAVDPISIEALPDGTILVLDRNVGQAFSRLLRYRGGELLDVLSLHVITRLLEPDQVAAFKFTAHDFAFVRLPEESDQPPRDLLFVVGDDGVQAFGFTVTWTNDRIDLTPQADFLPLRLFRGKALVAAGKSAHYDYADRWVPLVAQKRPRFAPEGTLYTPLALVNELERPAFDGREPGCVWHRVLIDACLPPECLIHVESRAADDPALLLRSDWVDEPPLYRRNDGSELPFATRRAGEHFGTWELLLQRARGDDTCN